MILEVWYCVGGCVFMDRKMFFVFVDLGVSIIIGKKNKEWLCEWGVVGICCYGFMFLVMDLMCVVSRCLYILSLVGLDLLKRIYERYIIEVMEYNCELCWWIWKILSFNLFRKEVIFCCCCRCWGRCSNRKKGWFICFFM